MDMDAPPPPPNRGRSDSLSMLKIPGIKAQWIKEQMDVYEPEFTETQSFRVWCGTFNVNVKKPSSNLHTWLDETLQPDIYCIGFQEVDMSVGAVLLHDEKKAGPWEDALTSLLCKNYHFIGAKQLVGIYLCMFVKMEHKDAVQDIRWDSVGCGLLGVMGNKGAVACRFQLYDSTFCFVNSHLAARMDEVSRRNQDYKELARKLSLAPEDPTAPRFTEDGYSPDPLAIWQHEHLFWVGDLNYRITLPDLEVRRLAAAGDVEALLPYDQLLIQKKMRNAFEQFDEGPITFGPSYKFNPGTNIYDTSEKKRTPAWCDRVQWRRSALVKQLRYTRHDEIMISDHKPVSALFDVKVKQIILEKRRHYLQEVLHTLDRMENDSMPDAEVRRKMVVFSDVRYETPQVESFWIENVGQVVAKFLFIPKEMDNTICKPYFKVKPEAGLILPGEQVRVDITCHVTAASAADLCNGSETMDDILLLHLEHGKDIFVPISANYVKSCFGNTLDQLCAMPGSVSEDLPLVPGLYRVPKQLFALIDYLSRRSGEPELFLVSGEPKEMEQIREFLDNDLSFADPSFQCDTASMAQSLIDFLVTLAEPVIPCSFYQEAITFCEREDDCKRLVAHLPPVHRNSFLYIVSFLNHVLSLSHLNGLHTDEIASVFSQALMRPNTKPEMLKITYPDAVKRRKFLLHFLTRSTAHHSHHTASLLAE